MELKDKLVLVAGAGISGIGAVGLLKAAGADVILYDGNEKLQEESLYEKMRVSCVQDLDSVDVVLGELSEEIAEETGKDRKEVLTDFLCSKTGKALYDEKTKLWCNGPAYITELYREELKKS